MKKIISLLLFCCMLCGVACAAGYDLSAYTDAQLIGLRDAINAELAARAAASGETINFGAASFAYKGAEYRDGRNGKKYLIINYQWTNTGDQSNYAATALSMMAYQNGVELDDGLLMDVSTNAVTALLPGASLDCCEIYELRDNSPVTLVVDAIADIMDQYPDYTLTINPQ